MSKHLFILLQVPLQLALPLDTGLLKNRHLGLDGEHQYLNSGLAIALSSVWHKMTGNLKSMNIDEHVSVLLYSIFFSSYLAKDHQHVLCGNQSLPEQFVSGLSRARLEGRAQIVPDSLGQQQNSNLGGLTFYLDGAHSPESMEMCAKWYSHAIREDPSRFGERPHENHHMRQVNSILLLACPDWDIKLCLFIFFYMFRLQGGHPNSLGGKDHQQILLFNCMSVRDPQLLLPRLINTCDQHGKSDEEHFVYRKIHFLYNLISAPM